jgi:putative membrane protein
MVRDEMPEPSKAALQQKLALDRTMLAWIRTALSMASFGFALVAFFRAWLALYPENPRGRNLYAGAVVFGTALLVLGVAALIASCLSHVRTLGKLRRGETTAVARWPLSVSVALMVALIGLVGVWLVFRRE